MLFIALNRFYLFLKLFRMRHVSTPKSVEFETKVVVLIHDREFFIEIV